MGRIIIFTGKGGVGKSSVASAHALKAAREGKRTLIISTDMAHNLSDIFMKDIVDEPVEIMKNLWALEVDPNNEMEKSYGSIMNSMKKMLSSQSALDADSLEDIVVFPGMEELFSLLRIKELYERDLFELIIVDCAPTGETLSLLKFPELFSWYMEKLLPIGKVALKVLRPIAKLTYKIDMPDNEAVNDIEKLYLKLIQLQNLLKDREVCSIRLVTIPEKMVVEETKRSYMYLNLYNFNVDGIYMNRLIPKEVDNHFYDDWKKIQKKYYEELRDVFRDIPTFNIKWYEIDINGEEGLERIIKDSLQHEKLFEVLKTTMNETFEKLENGYLLKVYVPFTDKRDFELFETGTDVIIKIGNFKRNIPLPNVIRKFSITGAKFNDGVLTISFE